MLKITFIISTWICATLSLAPREDLIKTLKFKPDRMTKTSILREHDNLNDDFHQPNSQLELTQLAYITPVRISFRCGEIRKELFQWNRGGYDLAEKTAHKLTHVSPVWFQARPSQIDGVLNTCKIEGMHEIKRDWLESLREKNEKIKIVPRIIFDEWSSEQMKAFLMDAQTAKRCFEDIANFYSRNQLDGAVVELYMQALISIQSLQIKSVIIESLHDLKKSFRKLHMQVIYTVPAPLEWDNQPNNLITPGEYRKLTDAADFVQIMTYDYRGNKPAGVAPYDWFESCIFYLGGGTKTLAGLNFYGYEFSKGKVDAITFDRYLKVLKSDKTTLSFDENSMEHKLKTPTSVIYYPSLTSLELRINMAHRYDVGIAIWDYGQGLNHFTNLLI